MVDIPPGITHDGPMVEVASGGAEHDWIKYEKVKEYTNAFVILNDQKVSACNAGGIYTTHITCDCRYCSA